MKKILITGASGGIGSSIADKFLKNKYEMILTSSSDATLSNLKNKYGKNHHYYILDFKNPDENNIILKKISDEHQDLDVIVNNAGITGPTAPLWEYDIEMWNKIVQINLVGTFNCCRAIVPNMIENNYGRIVNVASVAGKDGNANASAYSSGKAGTIGLTKSLGKELADKNIAVNAVTPAGAKTRILDQMSKEHVQRMLSKVPRGRFLEIHEFTSLVCWLSSEENTFSTAAVFDISGGRSTY